MTIASNLERIINAKADIKAAIGEKNVTVPDGTLISDYHTYIDQIQTIPPIDPNNPTFEGIKLALATDDPASYFPVGTEIPDTYDGKDNPMIVAQYLNSTNNSAYDGAVGAILIRKFVEPTSQVFGDDGFYPDSTIDNFLNVDYQEKCSSDVKMMISNLSIPYYYLRKMLNFSKKWFLMGNYEICGRVCPEFLGEEYSKIQEGVMWDYWKQKTGLSTPDLNSNSGRVVTDRNGKKTNIWLRSYCSIAGDALYDDGKIGDYDLGWKAGVLPACFIAKD